MSRRYNLKLFNENIRIVSEMDDAYIETLYKYILSTIERFDNVGTTFPMNYLTKALYACVFMADAVLMNREEVEELKAKLEEQAAKLEELEKTLEIKKKYKTADSKKKETKEDKEVKEIKETKESKEPKSSKASSKTSKETKDSKNSKDSK